MHGAFIAVGWTPCSEHVGHSTEEWAASGAEVQSSAAGGRSLAIVLHIVQEKFLL